MKMPIQIGVDEVGRGCVAGPVFVGFCAVYSDTPAALFEGIRDSKQISAQKREEWNDLLIEAEKRGDISLHTTSQTAHFIDQKGISAALHDCIERGIRDVAGDSYDMHILLDGTLKAPTMYRNQDRIIKGDTRIPAISAASIHAKVVRDREVSEYEKEYPDYKFSQHKGYGTSQHIQSIQNHGVTAHHRKTFLTRYI